MIDARAYVIVKFFITREGGAQLVNGNLDSMRT